MKAVLPGMTIIACAVMLQFCRPERKIGPVAIDYQNFKDSLLLTGKDKSFDTTNIFDSGTFIPDSNSVDGLFKRLDSMWRNEQKFLTNRSSFYAQNSVQINISVLESFFSAPETDTRNACKEKDCALYAEIVKAKQVLYLYLGGKLVDSFKVSTGVSGFETPSFSSRPSGPIFTEYTSQKFPGGDYKGLGNMPYAVFVKGGYAIHGTTPGNFRRLGSPASHGCIRLHPDDAKVFNELVKQVGLRNTWITIKAE